MIKKERNFGIDLLKIISMYMIAILHILGQGGILSKLTPFSLKYNLSWLLEITCYCSVNCYALITGYLMVNLKIKYKKIITLWVRVVFWSVLITLLLKIKYPLLVTKIDLLHSLLPVTFEEYWYFTAYFCLFFFIPFINTLINNITKKQYKQLITIIIILFSIINIIKDPFKLNNGYSFLWLMSCYILGAYIFKYQPLNNINKMYICLGSILPIIITFAVKLLHLKYPNITYGILGENTFVKYNSITILITSICLLTLFSNLKINNKYFKRFIKRLAPASFGVYIIHVQPKFWTIIMYERFTFLLNYSPIKMIVLVLFFAFLLYMLCSYLEMFRIYLFKKMKITILIDKIIEKAKIITS